MTATPPAPDELQLILGEFGGSISSLSGGTSPVYRIDLADGTSLVLKTYDHWNTGGPAREDYAARLLAELGVPVTRFLVIDDTRTRLAVPYAVTSFLPGVNARSLRDEPGVSAVYGEMGDVLRRLHSVRLPAYGEFDGRGIVDPVADNAEDIVRGSKQVFAYFRGAGGDDRLAQRLEDVVKSRMDVAQHSSGPVFAHHDLHPGNVLVERTVSGVLRMSGVIDFGLARAADAVFDLAKTLVISEYEAPGSSHSIRASYGPVAHPDPEMALRLYSLLHRVGLWCWLRQRGIISDDTNHPLTADLLRSAEVGLE